MDRVNQGRLENSIESFIVALEILRKIISSNIDSAYQVREFQRKYIRAHDGMLHQVQEVVLHCLNTSQPTVPMPAKRLKLFLTSSENVTI